MRYEIFFSHIFFCMHEVGYKVLEACEVGVYAGEAEAEDRTKFIVTPILKKCGMRFCS